MYLKEYSSGFRNPFLVSLLTGHHVSDHGILGENIFIQKEDKIVNLSSTSAWESAQSFDTIWVSIVKYLSP